MSNILRVLNNAREALVAAWARLRRHLHGWPDGVADTPAPYRVERLSEVPDDPTHGVLYVVGEGAHEWYAVVRCPCGCSETLLMSLLPDARPRWTVAVDEDGLPSLSPSVNRLVGCRSHFFIRAGQVDWCAPG